MKKLKLTKARREAIREAIKRTVESMLPEDEHDHVANWVYDVAIIEAWTRGATDMIDNFSASLLKPKDGKRVQ